MIGCLKSFIEKYMFCILLLLVVVYFFVLGSLKNGLFVDEIFSFGHANSSVGAFLGTNIDSHFVDENKELHGKWLDSEIFKKYLTVQEGEEWNFSQIIENVKKDVHPPFYLMILHTVSSLFPNMINKQIGLSLNLFFLICLVGVFYRFQIYYLKDKWKAFFVTLGFMFLPVVIELASFIRMYELFLLLNVILLYLSVKVIEKTDVSFKIWGGIFGVMMIALLTHFYQLVYGFFLTTGVMTVLFVDKRYGDSFKFGLVMLLGVIGAVAVFPHAIDMLLYSDRGEDSLSGFLGFDLEMCFFRIDYFLKQFFRASFGNSCLGHWGILGIIVGVFVWYAKEFGKERLVDKKRILMLWVAIMGCFVISIVAPDMRKFSGRYYAVATLFLFVGLFPMLIDLFSKNKVRKIVGGVVFVLFVARNVFLGLNNPYLLLDNDVDKFEDFVKDRRVVSLVGYKEVLFSFEMLKGFMKADEVYKLSLGEFNEVDEFLKSDELKRGDVVIAYAGMGKSVGNKKTLERKKYRLRYKDLVFVGMKSYEIYERY